MLEAIYTGDELGSGGGGGGSTNPTSGIMPVNILGTFQDSLISCDVTVGNGTQVTISDASELIELKAGTSLIQIDGASDDINIDGTNGVQLNGGVFINNHLGLAILKFLSGGSSHASIKVSGNRLMIRNGNDTAYNDLEARQIIANTTIQAISTISASEFIVTTKSKLQSPTDGIFLLLNNAGTSFDRVQLGGTTAAFPAIRRDGNGIDIMNADLSAYTNVDANDVTARGNSVTFGSFVFGGSLPKGSLTPNGDGVITLLNAAGNDFKFLQFGGTTAAFPMLSKISGGLAIRTANDTANLSLTVLNLTATGSVTTAADFIASARSILSSLVDSNFTLYNQAKTNFNLLQFGGITSAFPALKRSGTDIEFRLADDSNYTGLRANSVRSENSFISSNVLMSFITGGGSTVRMALHQSLGLNINLSGTSTNNASAIVQLDSTTKGFLPPRMTDTNRLAIASPAQGLMVYQINTNGPSLEGLYIYKSTGWTFII